MQLEDSAIEKYSDFSDVDPGCTIRRIKEAHSIDGGGLMQAHLLRVGIHVQHRRLRVYAILANFIVVGHRGWQLSH